MLAVSLAAFSLVATGLGAVVYTNNVTGTSEELETIRTDMTSATSRQNTVNAEMGTRVEGVLVKANKESKVAITALQDDLSRQLAAEKKVEKARTDALLRVDKSVQELRGRVDTIGTTVTANSKQADKMSKEIADGLAAEGNRVDNLLASYDAVGERLNEFATVTDTLRAQGDRTLDRVGDAERRLARHDRLAHTLQFRGDAVYVCADGAARCPKISFEKAADASELLEERRAAIAAAELRIGSQRV